VTGRRLSAAFVDMGVPPREEQRGSRISASFQ
jgi:hypothetical protein